MRLLRRLYIYRSLVTSTYDMLVAGMALVLAMFLRLGMRITDPATVQVLMIATPLFMGIALATFTAFGMYRGVWRYASIPDLMTIVKASTLAVLIFIPFLFFVTRLEMMPRTVPLIQWLMVIMLLGGSRMAYRALRSRRLIADTDRAYSAIPVIVYGTGDEAEQFLRATRRGSMYKPVALLDDKRNKHGSTIHGIKVSGGIYSLDRVLQRLNRRDIYPQKMIIADKSLLEMKGDLMRHISERAAKHGLSVARLPKLTEMKTVDEETTLQLQPIAIEDLLGRPQQVMNRDAIRQMIEGQRVLITGAGGSIGSEIVLQVAGFQPAAVCLLDSSEHNLYQIDQRLGEEGAVFNHQAVLADVRDLARLEHVFASFKPDVVFHAAAYKHVPIVEHNPVEGAHTNVLGSYHVAQMAIKHAVKAMVQISTDKAVNPTNIMGATKKLAEMMCQALDRTSTTTRFMTVRFGNVLGSSGSVVPLFRKQLERGGPITVTDPKIERYFMTIPEAVGLVLSASAFGLTQTERGRIFVLDMGDPIKIDDLARHMIRLAGLEPDKDIHIVYTGLRPGEKLYEELFNAEEKPLPTDLPNIQVAEPFAADETVLAEVMRNMDAAIHAQDSAAVVAVLAGIVPNFTPRKAKVA